MTVVYCSKTRSSENTTAHAHAHAQHEQSKYYNKVFILRSVFVKLDGANLNNWHSHKTILLLLILLLSSKLLISCKNRYFLNTNCHHFALVFTSMREQLIIPTRCFLQGASYKVLPTRCFLQGPFYKVLLDFAYKKK